jgi:hypothetical protein
VPGIAYYLVQLRGIYPAYLEASNYQKQYQIGDKMKTKVDIELKDVFDLLDKKYELVYIDRSDNLDDNLQSVQDAVQSRDMSKLDEKVDEWFTDSAWESADYVMTHDLPDAMMDRFDMDRAEAMDFIEDHRYEIQDEIYNRDCSTPIADLLRNTTDPVAFYETDLSLCEPYDAEDVKKSLRSIKKTLKIPAKNHEYDAKLRVMIEQAGYGGSLVIYFSMTDIEGMINLYPGESISDVMIKFTNPMIAIIDTFNGSGDSTDLKGYSFSLPYNPELVYLDKCIKYNYTYAVCGMSWDWCGCTDISFYKTGKKNKIAPKPIGSSIADHLAQEKMFNEAFKAGGCTFGDMDLNRHRNTYYLNEYPCGTHCPHCGTFFID